MKSKLNLKIVWVISLAMLAPIIFQPRSFGYQQDIAEEFKAALAREEAIANNIKDITLKIRDTNTQIEIAKTNVINANITIDEAKAEIEKLDIQLADLETNLLDKAIDTYISNLTAVPQDPEETSEINSPILNRLRSEELLDSATVSEAELVEDYRVVRQDRAIAVGNALNGEIIKSENLLAQEEKKKILEVQKAEQEQLQKENKERIDEIIKEIDTLEEFDKELQNEVKERVTQEAIDAGALSWPVDSPYVSSSFGNRFHPIYRKYRLHAGIDLRASVGTPVYAAADGKVILAKRSSSAGNYVIIDHGAGKETRYLHLSAFSVKQGQTVSRGQLVGKSGNTGASTGPHLHFEVRINGVPKNPQDYIVG